MPFGPVPRSAGGDVARETEIIGGLLRCMNKTHPPVEQQTRASTGVSDLALTGYAVVSPPLLNTPFPVLRESAGR